MISYAKSAAVPSSLNRGVGATAIDCASYDGDPASYRSGKAKFEIKSSIYGTKIVKRALKADQHDKCAFCEAIFDGNAAGDVEHYRPKGAVDTGAGKLAPGYYWVGYAWANLSYACPDCNEYRKRDQFPLADEAARARSHHDNLALEEPLLLDPYGPRNPRDHIIFRGETPIAQSPEGDATIRVLSLDRVALMRDRLNHLRGIRRTRDSIKLLEDDPRPEAIAHVAELRAVLAAAVLPTATFSAATVDYLVALAGGEDFLP